MTTDAPRSPFPIAVFPGASGEELDLSAFAATDAEFQRLETIHYPDWRRYASEDFTADALLRELTANVASRSAGGRIAVVGYSLGAHFGYIVALRLQEMGVEVAGFCAIDGFMVSSADAKPGWGSRHLASALGHLRGRSFEKLSIFARQLFWRSLMRLAGANASVLLRGLRDHGGVIRSALTLDPLFEKEATIRLLVREIAPWLAALDREPTPLPIPAALVRTNLTRGDDPAWRRRCPNIQIIEVAGDHHTLFDPENIGALREAFLGVSRGWR